MNRGDDAAVVSHPVPFIVSGAQVQPNVVVTRTVFVSPLELSVT
jgi:hypothetical protein